MKKIILLLVAACWMQYTSLAQNVGIGESNPVNKLEIKGNTADPFAGAILVKNSVNDTLLRISNSGQLGVGTSPSLSPTYRFRLHSPDLGNFIHFSNTASGNTEYNGATIGIYDQNMYLHNLNNGYITLRTSNFERMRITADGNIGIGVSDPAFMLDVNGRARIRHNGATAGIWFNNSLNTFGAGFVGLLNDNTIGMYGTGSGWAMLMNTTNGNSAFGGTPDNNTRLITSGPNTALYTSGTSTTSTSLKLGTGKIVVEGAGVNTPTPVFVFKGTASNTYYYPEYIFSVIDNPYCNNNPNAILIATPNGTYGSGTGRGYTEPPELTSTYHVFYMGPGHSRYSSVDPFARDKWCIRMTLDLPPFVASPENHNFNIMIITPN